MDRETQKALEAAGFAVEDAEDFLGLNEEERRLVELRVRLIRAVRRLRERRQITQQQLAAKLKSSQSRVAKMEAGAPGVSLDLLFRGLFALGGGLADLGAPEGKRPGRRRRRVARPARVPGPAAKAKRKAPARDAVTA